MLQIDREIFDLKPAGRGLGASLIVHAVAVAALVGVTVPTAQERPRHFTAICLPRTASPAHRRSVIKSPKSPVPKSSAAPRPAQILQTIVPQRAYAAAVALPEPSVEALPSPVPESLPLPELPAPQRPAPARQRIDTATGLFESVAATANGPSAAKIQTGAFDAQPNMTAKSVRALAPVAGFGDVAVASKEHSAPQTSSSTGFGAVSRAPAVRRTSPGTGVSEPIEILAKPKPLYTEEARRLRIEGEVVLEVLFRASAQVRVLRVLKGLGHGLDASAEIAAMGIRFHPAAEAGRAVDSVATVKIEFQLAD